MPARSISFTARKGGGFGGVRGKFSRTLKPRIVRDRRHSNLVGRSAPWRRLPGVPIARADDRSFWVRRDDRVIWLIVGDWGVYEGFEVF